MKKVLILGLWSLAIIATSCSNNGSDADNNDKDTTQDTTIAGEVNNQKDTAREYLLSGIIEQDIYYLLPEGLIKAELMKINYSQRYKDIILRLKNNANTHKEWFEEFYAKGKETGEVDYDPGLGITEAEFKYINTYKGEFEKIVDVDLVAKVTNKDITLTCDKLPAINNMRFAMEDYYVTLSRVACKYEGKFEVIDNTYPGGLKKGHFWKYENISGGATDRKEQLYEVRLAELKSTGNIMMYVGIHDVGNGEPKSDEFVLIYKPLLRQ